MPLKTMSRLPFSVMTFFIYLSIWVSFKSSTCPASAWPPFAVISSARACTFTRLRAVTYTFAPWSAKDRATAAAISPEAANTTATLVFSVSISCVFSLDEWTAGNDRDFSGIFWGCGKGLIVNGIGVLHASFLQNRFDRCYGQVLAGVEQHYFHSRSVFAE